jgi:hypothetical protein
MYPTKGCELKEFCIHNEVCNFDKGEIYENVFQCSGFENIEMFLNKLVEMNIDK